MDAKPFDIRDYDRSGDVVLQELMAIKLALSESYGHDVHRLFEITREHEKESGHPILTLEEMEKKSA